MQEMKKFEGLIAAPFAPLNGAGEVMPEAIPGYCEFLEKNKVVGAFINGSTGEGVSLPTRRKWRSQRHGLRQPKTKTSK